MTRFLTPALITLAFAAAAAPTQAAQTHAAPTQAEPAAARQSVMICRTDVATRRAYEREHGVKPIFVSARETVAAREAGETWSQPRCMTEREYSRLIATTQTRASL